ncbi:MAG: hypothetical protein JWL95_2214, partial [Gemmatimonadetes bacterium]|nr:hypothetical protein [Gemmatimonadota bacterium]
MTNAKLVALPFMLLAALAAAAPAQSPATPPRETRPRIAPPSGAT